MNSLCCCRAFQKLTVVAIRIKSADTRPYSWLLSASPPSARWLPPAKAGAFAWETSRVGQFTTVHHCEKANPYEISNPKLSVLSRAVYGQSHLEVCAPTGFRPDKYQVKTIFTEAQFLTSSAHQNNLTALLVVVGCCQRSAERIDRDLNC